MCGGVVFNIEKVPEEDLNKVYSKEQIDYFKKKGIISSFFWDEKPVLPAIINGKIRLFDWGSRDKKLLFPLTGWAKIDSVKEGKWNWLHPSHVKIPVTKGYEKKTWFDFKNGTEGIIVDINSEKKYT